MAYPVLTLKRDRDAHLKNRHHAIYKTAVLRLPVADDGAIVEVRDADHRFLCYATLNKTSYICGRAIAFEEGDPLASMRRTMERAVDLRRRFVIEADTTAYRVINAEGDALPGLIADLYGDVLVVQFTTLGMDRLREWVLKQLSALIKPRAIFEKSTGPSRKKEGLLPREGWIQGKVQGDIDVLERGVKYLISLEGSQKTGLFLDQREMRSLVRSFAKGRTVLDCCSYVGGFSVNALLGGAIAVDAVDYDEAALKRAGEHVALNGCRKESFGSYREDAFNFFRRSPLPRTYDFIILDPPAFAKRSADIIPAKRSYTDLNRMAFAALAPQSLLLTCSCSYQVDSVLFQTLVFHAARLAGRSAKIIARHRVAMDHPVNLYHPEGEYLKSLLLWVE